MSNDTKPSWAVGRDSWGGWVPAPFNPHYDPKSKDRYKAVSDSMTRDNYYADHTRAQCAAEWKRRYDKLKQEGSL